MAVRAVLAAALVALPALAGCASIDEAPRAEEPAPAPPAECGEPARSLVRLNVTGLPGDVRSAWLVPEREAAAREDCRRSADALPLVPIEGAPVEHGRYRELRVISDRAVARIALVLDVAKPGSLDVLVAPAAAAVEFRGERIPVARAEIVDDPLGLVPFAEDREVPLDVGATVSLRVPVASGWNDGLDLRYAIGGEEGSSPEARVEIRVYSPAGELALARTLRGGGSSDRVLFEDAERGDWRVLLETWPAREPGEGAFTLGAWVSYGPQPFA